MLDAAAVASAVESARAVYFCVHTLSKQADRHRSRDFMDVEQAGLRNVIDAAHRHGGPSNAAAPELCEQAMWISSWL
jgi:hypothetical protein